MLEYLIEFGQMSNEENLEWSAAASENGSISLHYKEFLSAILLLQEKFQHLKDSILEVTETETSVI